MKFKRFLSILLACAMLLSLMPTSILAQSTSKTVTIDLTAQAMGAFLCAPQLGVEVSSDLSAKYGFDDERLDDSEGVSALDVILRAHEIVFGEDFTPQNVEDYINGTASYLIDAFGGIPNLGFAVNGKCPNDGVWNEIYNAYTGYAADQTVINDGDFVELFCYADDYWMDNYVWFLQESDKVDKLEAVIGADIDLELNGYCYCYYGCSKQETIDDKTDVIEAAQLAWVDAQTGEIKDIEDAITDEDGAVSTKAPEVGGTYYLTAYMPQEEIEENYATPIIMPLIKVTVKEPSNAKITVPDDCTLTLARKDYSGYNYKPFEPVESVATIEHNDEQTVTYYYDLTNGKEYYYRASGEDYVTYAGYFAYKTANGADVEITKELLAPDGKTKTTIDHNTSANNGFNVADIYLNINEKGYLKMAEVGDTYQLIHLRNWQAINSTTANVFAEPDYHYTALDENGNESDAVVEISDKGVITAKGEGVAIVLVTYDAMSYAQSLAAAGTFYGAIWPENTGVFVVTVGKEDSNITTGITLNEGRIPQDTSAGKLSGDALDAEHDVIYFVGDEGSYAFAPQTEGCSVYVANPTVADAMSFAGFEAVEPDADGLYNIPLAHGRNIVKIEKDGKAEYQVITAKRVNIDGIPELAVPGQEISIKFDTLYHPSNKLAGIYNMAACVVYQTPDGKLAGGTSNQYAFGSTAAAQTLCNIVEKQTKGWSTTYAKKSTLTIPSDWAEDTYVLSGGSIVVLGFGDPFGNHRGITLENGKAPNLNAAVKEAFLGKLPDITIPVSPKVVKSIEITTPPTKTQYYEGDTFDKSGMVVTATYDDDTTAVVENYSVTAQPFGKDDTVAQVTYGGKTADVAVEVIALKVTGIKVTKAPDKTTYTAGDVIDPTGMEVTAEYNNGSTGAFFDYSYSPNRELTKEDTQITVTFDEFSDIIPITVEGGSSSGSGSDNITVSISLLGDDKHDSDTDGKVHTLKAGNLKTWIAKTKITLPKGSCVIDAISKALGLNGIPFSNAGGNYIDSVRGLSEMDNGKNSGWMYTLNGKYPNLGVAEQGLKNGDVIVFHYTDDYTAEQLSGSMSSGSSSSSGSSKPAEQPTEQTKPDITEDDNSTKPTAFVDVESDSWYEAAVNYVTQNRLFNGVSENEFEPNSTMTRAMLVTVLWRLEGSPKAEAEIAFDDVKSGEWYTEAIRWATANGIVTGYDNSKFGVDDSITREQMATILWRRYAKFKENDVSADGMDMSAFEDMGDVSDYAIEPIKWANKCGLINGETPSAINPKGDATRAQVAVIFMRFCTMNAK